MPVLEDFQTMDDAFYQIALARKYRDRFCELYETLKQLDANIIADKDGEQFNLITDDVKNCLKDFWQNVIQAGIAKIESNSDYMDMINSKN